MTNITKYTWAVAAVLACASCGRLHAAGPSEFLTGGDISMLTRIEKLGGVFRDGGRQRDFLDIFKTSGTECFRLRIGNQDATALFDKQGNALPAIKAFKLK
jgi:arabinogalactan endo-1,4-beta-galactosidase